jgi:hypothetical protein
MKQQTTSITVTDDESASLPRARENSGSSLHWIAVSETRFVLPLGGHRIHLYEMPDGAWRVQHVGRRGGSRHFNGAQPLTFPRAKQFAERYARACYRHDVDFLGRTDAPWRQEPMTERQRCRLVLAMFGEEPDPAMTAGEASDLFQIIAARREAQA